MKGLLAAILCLLTASAFARSTLSGRTTHDMMYLSESCKDFRAEYGVYPPTETWLDELQATSNASINAKQIQFIRMNRLADAWGNPFVYRSPGKHNPESFDLYSMGVDGASGTGGNDPDDIANWHDWRRMGRYYRRFKYPFVTPLNVILMVGVGVGIAVIVRIRKKR